MGALRELPKPPPTPRRHPAWNGTASLLKEMHCGRKGRNHLLRVPTPPRAGLGGSLMSERWRVQQRVSVQPRGTFKTYLGVWVGHNLLSPDSAQVM